MATNIYDGELNTAIVSNSNTVWGQRTLESNWELEPRENLQSMYGVEAFNEIYSHIAEEIRNTIDGEILENIVGVQPMEGPTGEIYYLDFNWNKRKKLELRLPDELFEME